MRVPEEWSSNAARRGQNPAYRPSGAISLAAVKKFLHRLVHKNITRIFAAKNIHFNGLDRRG